MTSLRGYAVNEWDVVSGDRPAHVKCYAGLTHSLPLRGVSALCCAWPAFNQVIDPYVKVEMHGVPADHKAVVTKHINDNGGAYVTAMHHMSPDTI